MRQQGLTLLETMVGASITLVLLTAVFFVFRMGASAMMKVSARNELLQGLQTASTLLARDVEQSVYGSLSLTPGGGAISFLSALDDNGDFQVDGLGAPLWQRYVIYYHAAAPASELRRLEVPLAAGSPEQTAPGPIESYGPSQVLSTYLSGGRVIAQHVFSARFLVDTAAPLTRPLVIGEFEGRQKRYGRSDEEVLQIRSSALIRN